jgi:hypothetical protein
MRKTHIIRDFLECGKTEMERQSLTRGDSVLYQRLLTEVSGIVALMRHEIGI